MLKSWTKLEKVLLFGSILLISIVGIICKSDILTTLCAIVGVVTVLLLAKGKNLGQIFGVLIAILYSIVSFKNRYYGEVMIYLIIMLPMHIIGIFSWFRHKNEKTDSVEVNKISKKEWIIVALLFSGIFVGIYYLLKAFNTNELIVSTISVLASLFACYLQIRRSRFSFGFYMINDIILMVLWGIPVVKGSIVLLPILLDPTINFINDSYGFYNWRKMEKEQKE
ncbi:MAG: nicotinamide riboside transporter PnuC [Clostridia bacterium]|nr:nicotinamide riboside transporter PnuC [Clostridia bacterium]